MWGVGRRHRRELKSRDGFLLVALIWVMVAATATVPLILGLGMSFTDAYFETVSGRDHHRRHGDHRTRSHSARP